MKICITYNKEYSKLKNLFLQSFENDNRISIIENIISTNGQTGFGTDSWYKSVTSKIEFIIHTLKNTKDKIICLSDIDIFYGNIDKLIIDAEIFENSIFELAACYEKYSEFLVEKKEYKLINSGFMMIKNNSSNITLFESVLQMDLRNFKYGDQDALNVLLRDKNIPCYRFPPEEYICHCYLKAISKENIRKSVLYHANCIEDFGQKINKLRTYKILFTALNKVYSI